MGRHGEGRWRRSGALARRRHVFLGGGCAGPFGRAGPCGRRPVGMVMGGGRWRGGGMGHGRRRRRGIAVACGDISGHGNGGGGGDGGARYRAPLERQLPGGRRRVITGGGRAGPLGRPLVVAGMGGAPLVRIMGTFVCVFCVFVCFVIVFVFAGVGVHANLA